MISSICLQEIPDYLKAKDFYFLDLKENED
jgi:hypothetical protein